MGEARQSRKKNETADRAQPIKQRPILSKPRHISTVARWVPRDRRCVLAEIMPRFTHPTCHGAAAVGWVKRGKAAKRTKPPIARNPSSSAQFFRSLAAYQPLQDGLRAIGDVFLPRSCRASPILHATVQRP
jgi:hypothetical protein